MIFPGISPSSAPKIAPHTFIRTSYISICTVHAEAAHYFNQCHIQADRNRSAAGKRIKNTRLMPQEVYRVQENRVQKTFDSLWNRNWTLKTLPNPKLPFISPPDFLTAIL